MAVYGYTKNYKLIKPQFDADTWHDYEYDNLDTIDAVLSAIFASGDWQGFWKSNAHYAAGGVVIDKDTDTMYKIMVEHTTSEATFAAEFTAHPTYYELWSPNNLAEDWAIKTDDKVSYTDYSSKAYAVSSGLIDDGSAKEWANKTDGTIGNTNEYSAKKYAQDSALSASTATSQASSASASATLASKWASQETDPVEGSNYSAKQYSLNAASSADTAAGHATSAHDEAVAASNSATLSANSATLAQQWAIKTDGTVDETEYSAKHYAQQSNTSAQSAQDAVDTVNGLIAFPLGTIIQAIYIDESLNIARRLNGQVIIQSQFVSFTNKVKAAIALYPSLSTTETNWQAEKTNSKLGQCGKFVIDDTAGTIRLPCVVNAQGLVDLALIGGIKSESLPNHYHVQGASASVVAGVTARYGKTDTGISTSHFDSGGPGATTLGYNTSGAYGSSTYQDNAPVQQEAVQYPYYIVVNTGVEEAERPINNYQVNNVYSYGMSQYYKGTMNNNSWLRSQGQWNDGTVYTGIYNWLLEQMNAGVSGFVASTGEYTDYDFVINTADQTFRLPLLNGEESVINWDRFDALTVSNSDQLYTAPANGCYAFSVLLAASTYFAIFKGNSGDVADLLTNENAAIAQNYVAKTSVKQGDTIRIQYIGTPTVHSARFYYAKGNGNLYYYVGDTLQNADLINVARIEETLVTKTNKVQAAAASMPSGRYIDLTLGASGSTYTAPANGWFFASGNWAPDGSQFNVTMDVGAYGVQAVTGVSGSTFFRVLCPVVKGAIMTMSYTLATIVNFRFIYAEGEK